VFCSQNAALKLLCGDTQNKKYVGSPEKIVICFGSRIIVCRIPDILREFGRKFCAISPQNFAGIWQKIVRFQKNSR
jgi:hypothetical protein